MFSNDRLLKCEQDQHPAHGIDDEGQTISTEPPAARYTLSKRATWGRRGAKQEPACMRGLMVRERSIGVDDIAIGVKRKGSKVQSGTISMVTVGRQDEMERESRHRRVYIPWVAEAK